MDQREFFRNFDKQVNKRIAKGIKQGLQLLIKKMDTIIDLKVDIDLKEIEQKQDRYEQRMSQKVMELKREFRDISQKRDSFYKQTMTVARKKDLDLAISNINTTLKPKDSIANNSQN